MVSEAVGSPSREPQRAMPLYHTLLASCSRCSPFPHLGLFVASVITKDVVVGAPDAKEHARSQI